ncbi:MAG: hypothetical protein WCM76_11510 [Bacteroidota bacterium]
MAKSNEVIERLKSKSAVKLQIFDNTRKVFNDLKEVAKEFAMETNREISKTHPKITVDFRDKGEFEADLKVAADMLVFMMHTNIFEFPIDHTIMKSSYVKKDVMRSYCGIIYVYNFLADSFKYNRQNDVGYLVARIFVNKEFRFIVEGKRQVEFLNNSFTEQIIDKNIIRKILETSVIYCVDFDLLLPPYDAVKEVSVSEMQEYTSNVNLRTGKRLGFRFQADPDETM